MLTKFSILSFLISTFSSISCADTDGSLVTSPSSSAAAPVGPSNPNSAGNSADGVNSLDSNVLEKLFFAASNPDQFDDRAVIDILASRKLPERLMLRQQYKNTYQRDLVEDLEAGSYGDFEKTLVAMVTPVYEYLASELNNAMGFFSTDKKALNYIICSATSNDIKEIKRVYALMYDKSLQDKVYSSTSGNYQTLMNLLLIPSREASNVNQSFSAANEAEKLYQAGEIQKDASTFVSLFAQKDGEQLQEIFFEYLLFTYHSAGTVIENRFSGDVRDALLDIFKLVMNQPGYYAEKLYLSMKGLGTDDASLVRLMVTLSNYYDMYYVREIFLKKYGQSLEDFIADDTSGSYRDCLLALLGNKQIPQ